MARSGSLYLVVLLTIFLAGIVADEKTKRQIFREEVQPHSGGKIPESAFRSDRLALNKLQKVGVAVPDGASLDTRAHNVVKVGGYDPESELSVVRIFQKDEGRYIPPEGKSYPEYPNTVPSTYRIRPPIGAGAYHLGPYIYHSVQGPPLTLNGASVEATHGSGANYAYAQQYSNPKYAALLERPSYAPAHAQYGRGYTSNDGNIQHIKQGFVKFPGDVNRHSQQHGNYRSLAHAQYANPSYESSLEDENYANRFSDIQQPTPSPEHAQFVGFGGLDQGLQFARDYPDLYSGLLQNYASTGLLQVSNQLRYSPYSFLSSYGHDDLSFRLRRKTDLEVSPATNVGSATKQHGGQASGTKFSCEGRQEGGVYSDPLSNCKRQFLCLSDGRAAAFVCPEGSRFDHRTSKCEHRRRRTKLDQDCNPV